MTLSILRMWLCELTVTIRPMEPIKARTWGIVTNYCFQFNNSLSYSFLVSPSVRSFDRNNRNSFNRNILASLYLQFETYAFETYPKFITSKFTLVWRLLTYEIVNQKVFSGKIM